MKVSRKISIYAAGLALLVAFCIAPTAFADSTSVTAAAALGGSGTACGGGPCGLEIAHDATTGAFVTDTTPDDETVYRAEFLIDPNSLGVAGAGYRIPIFNMIGPNPNPNVGNCGATLFKQAASAVLIHVGGNYSMQIIGNGNQCGAASGLPRKVPMIDGPNKVCVELESNLGVSGRFAVAVVAAGASCPTSGDAAYSVRTIFNPNARVDQVRFGTLQPTGNGASTPGSLYLDEFASFRTVNP